MNNVFIKSAKISSKDIKINRFIKTYFLVNRLYECKDENVR